jgi:hypothetical protein
MNLPEHNSLETQKAQLEDLLQGRPTCPTFYLWFDRDEGRFTLNGRHLHCGDCFDAWVRGEWVQTRIEHSGSSEHSHGWYLITHPNTPLQDLLVRRSA